MKLWKGDGVCTRSNQPVPSISPCCREGCHRRFPCVVGLICVLSVNEQGEWRHRSECEQPAAQPRCLGRGTKRLKDGSPDLNQLQERRAQVTLRLSEFEISPFQDLLLIGKRAPVGAEAISRMVGALSPDVYEIVPLEHGVFEAIVLKRSLVKQMPQEQLIALALEEGERMASQESVIKATVSVCIEVSRAVDF